MTERFRQRSLLRSAALNESDRALATLDAHHVAKVHRRQGVVDGLVLRIQSEGAELVVTSGCAYDPCGAIITADNSSTFQPPDLPGEYDVWLDGDGTVRMRPIRSSRTAGEVHLGSAMADAPAGQMLWTSILQTGRTEVPAPIAPHLAAGRRTLGLDDINFSDLYLRQLSISVSTVNGGFERTPLYFATFGVQDRPDTGLMSSITGWSTDICRPTATGFILQVYLLADLELSDIVGAANLAFDISWIGIDPRRDELNVLSRPCPALPQYTIYSPILFTSDTAPTPRRPR